MARRSRDWNEGLARDLKDPSFAREFLIGAVKEGVPLQQALAKKHIGSTLDSFLEKERIKDEVDSLAKKKIVDNGSEPVLPRGHRSRNRLRPRR